MAEYDPYKEPGNVSQGIYQQHPYQQQQLPQDIHLNYYNVEVRQPMMPPTYVVVQRENPTWAAPLAMLIIGAFMMLFFPPLSVLLWAVGAIFMLYPDSTTRLMGCLNCGACCLCSGLICLLVGVVVFTTFLPVLLTGALAAGASTATTN